MSGINYIKNYSFASNKYNKSLLIYSFYCKIQIFFIKKLIFFFLLLNIFNKLILKKYFICDFKGENYYLMILDGFKLIKY